MTAVTLSGAGASVSGASRCVLLQITIPTTAAAVRIPMSGRSFFMRRLRRRVLPSLRSCRSCSSRFSIERSTMTDLRFQSAGKREPAALRICPRRCAHPTADLPFPEKRNHFTSIRRKTQYLFYFLVGFFENLCYNAEDSLVLEEHSLHPSRFSIARALEGHIGFG